MLPKARDDGDLLIQPVGDEIVVYDVVRHDAHLLNRSAALVWKNCDGLRTVGDLTVLVRDEIAPEASEDTVLHALDLLREARLLVDNVEPDQHPAGSRRAFLRKLAMYGAPAAAAVIWSISSPTVAHAQSTPFCPVDEIPCPAL